MRRKRLIHGGEFGACPAAAANRARIVGNGGSVNCKEAEMGIREGTVRKVISVALAAARERRTTWRGIVKLVSDSFEHQSGERLGLPASDLEIERLERCPHSALESLWADLASALEEDDAYFDVWLSGKDFRRIIALVPEWLPAWAKKMRGGPTKKQKPCPYCKGRGVVDA